MTAAMSCDSPENVVETAYRLISFGPGGEPSWQSFRALFAQPCVLALRIFPRDPSVTVMSLEQYVQLQMREGMKEAGYEEKPIDRTVVLTGDIAEARVRFQMIFGGNDVHEALDIFQMVRREGRWWIVSILSEILAPDADRGLT